jgi:16S rRNA (cytosine1402-N4)-methyltransferase
MINSRLHEPVLLNEVLEFLKVSELSHLKKTKYIDATLGLGGHTQAIVKLKGNVLGLEADPKSLEEAAKRLKEACPSQLTSEVGSFTLVNANFKDLEKVAQQYSFVDVDGVLFDLGISSYQLGSQRGFSFQERKASLDLRMDIDIQGVKGADLLNILEEKQLLNLFGRVMPYSESRLLARVIISFRKQKKFESVDDFLKVIDKLPLTKKSLHPATLPFLALRVAVNSELEILEEALPQAFRLLDKTGRLVVISFHSGEDALVKKYFSYLELRKEGKIITDKPISANESELRSNPRSQSAKLRVLERL